MSGKIKILYTIPNFDTAGSGKAMLKIAQRLDPNKFEPHICCFHDQGKFFSVVKESGIPVHLFKYTTPMIPRLAGLRNVWKISRFLKSQKFDLIHSFHYADDYSEGLSARFAGIKWIFTKKNMNWGARSWKLRSKMATGIIAQNTDMIRNFYPDRNHVKLIGRGVDTNEFKPQSPAIEILNEFNLPANARVILTVANLVPVKGIEYLIDAFNQVFDQLENGYLFIVGENNNEYGDSLKAKVTGLSCRDQIIFTGKRLDVNKFQSIAHLFVLPTLNKGRQEGSPVSLLEAMACGSIVIASNIAGIRDQLSDIPDQLFQPGDNTGMAEKILQYLSLPANDSKVVIENQLKIIREKYTLEIEVEAHEQFYVNIMNA